MIAKKEKKRSLSQEINKSSIAKQNVPKKLKAENVDIPKPSMDSPKKKKEKKVMNKLMGKPENSDKTKLKPNKDSSSNNKSSTTDKSVVGKSDQTVKTKTTRRRNLMQKFLPMEVLRERIQELQAEDSLSKSAKKRLAIFKKKLTMMEQGLAPTTLEEHKARLEARLAGNLNLADKMVKKQAQKQKQENAKKNLKKTQNDKQNKKKAQQSQVVAKSDDEEEEDDDESDEEDDEDMSSMKQNAKKVGIPSRKTKQEEEEDSEDDDEEDEDDDDSEDANVSKMETDEDEEEEEDDDDDDEEEEDEAEESGSEEEATVTKKNSVAKKGATKNENEGKKKRYVLFVGNLPYTVDKDQVEKHFLTRVSEVISVRMPLKPDGSGTRGFAYVEFSNQTDYEKGLTLHESFLAGRKLNVQYSEPNAKFQKDKNKIIGKNKKLQELRKAGKLAGSKPNKKFQQNKKQK